MPTPNDIIGFINFLFSAQFQSELWPLRYLFFVISVGFFVFIISTVWRTHWFKFVFGYAWVEFFTLRPYGRGKAAKQWHEVRRQFTGPVDLDHYRQALLDARAILDDFLDDIVIFFQTTTCQQRLERLGPATISNIEALRLTVALTEKLAADPTYNLTEAESLTQLEVYHRAFVDLGIALD